MIANRQGSPTSLTFDNVVPVVAGSLNVPAAELFRIFQDVFVPERPVSKVDVSRASKTSTTHPQSRQAAESPILVQQQTNHVGRLVLLAGAPGCPTGSATGLLQWDSLQRSLVHGFGRLPTAPLRQTRPTRYSHRTADTQDKLKKDKRIQKQRRPRERSKTEVEEQEQGSPGAPRDSSP